MDFQIEKAVEILAGTPKTLRALLGNLSDQWTLEAVDAESWSAFDVLGHYIHGEQTDWIPRAKIILARGENLTFEPFDRFAQFEKSKGKSLGDLLDEFETLRTANINTLIDLKLTEADLELKGIHPELGEVTLEQLLSTWVVHDLNHIRQIVVGLAAKYADNVGVWKEYLLILQ
jgi:hypothetical protein